MVEAIPQRLAGDVFGLKVSMGKNGWMLDTGCTFMPETPEINLFAIREAVGKELSST